MDRKPLYAKIAIARKQLPDMTEEAYRDLLENEFSTRSARDLKYGQLCRLVDLLGRMGAVYMTPGPASCGARALASPESAVSGSLPHPADGKPRHTSGQGAEAPQSPPRPGQAKPARVRPHVRSDFYSIADDEFGKTKRYIAALWRNDLGYDMTSLDTLVDRMFGIASFAWLRDWAKLKRLACHVQRRATAKAEGRCVEATV